MSAHTPTPWGISERWPDRVLGERGDDGPLVAKCDSNNDTDRAIDEDRANAAHIVRCVNAHDELVAALQAAKSLIDEGEYASPEQIGQTEALIDAALAKAGAA